MNSTKKVGTVGAVVSQHGVSKCRLAMVLLVLASLSFHKEVMAQNIADGFQAANCPPETRQAPTNCQQVARIAYALATKKKGYADAGGNGIPDVMERPYVINVNDCSTGNAHAACMFNDPCTAPIGKVWGLRSNSARHATVMFEGTNGNKFECDFTPQSSGIAIAHRADTRIGPAFPDPGESMDPAYDCLMNGANTRPLNAFGGGGAMQSSIMALLMQMLQQQLQQKTPAPTPNVGDPGSATSTPTPEVTAIPASSTNIRSDTRRSQQSLDAIKIPDDDRLLGDTAGSDSVDQLEQADDQDLEIPAPKPDTGKTRSVWERDSVDIFGSSTS